MAVELVEVELWVMVDEDGEFEVSKDAGELQANAGQASRLVRITVSVPKPKAVELSAVIAEEPTVGELKAG
jgi:hypothetical protein